MYIDENGHEFDHIYFLEGDSINKRGFYFDDEVHSELVGPYNTLTESRRELRLYVYRLSYSEMDYDTFSDSRIYKTLPYIMDRVNEMDNYKRAQVSKYFNTLNKVCNDLSATKEDKEILYGIQKILCRKSGYSKGDISYYQSLVIKDFIARIDKQFSKYDTKFVSYLKNFTKAKISKLQ